MLRDSRNSYSDTLYLDNRIPSYFLVLCMCVTLKSTSWMNWSLDEIHLLLQELLVEGGALFSAVTPSFTTKMKKAAAVILNLIHQINDVLSSKSKFGVNSTLSNFSKGWLQSRNTQFLLSACLWSHTSTNNAAIIELFSHYSDPTDPNNFIPKYCKGILLHAKLMVFYLEKQSFQNKSAILFCCMWGLSNISSMFWCGSWWPPHGDVEHQHKIPGPTSYHA